MELGLSLEVASTAVGFLNEAKSYRNMSGLDFCMAQGLIRSSPAPDDEIESHDNNNNNHLQQLNLVLALNVNPHHRIQYLHWSSDNGSSENGSSGKMALPPAARGLYLDVNRIPAAEEVSSADSIRSPLFDRTGFSTLCPSWNKRSSKARDDKYEEENGMNARKKLRLSKQESSFLEESFKEHSTLNPKQKLALAKQLNLRPRQVEVWFQNRRARTKLKQMDVDCDYLKRRCETLTEDNRRLQKELQELRALKTTNNIPFHMKRPATTLTMCPSCQSVATTSAAAVPFQLTRPRFYPFSKNPDESS